MKIHDMKDHFRILYRCGLVVKVVIWKSRIRGERCYLTYQFYCPVCNMLFYFTRDQSPHKFRDRRKNIRIMDLIHMLKSENLICCFCYMNLEEGLEDE